MGRIVSNDSCRSNYERNRSKGDPKATKFYQFKTVNRLVQKAGCTENRLCLFRGMGESKFEQALESQAYAFAVKGFAERIMVLLILTQLLILKVIMVLKVPVTQTIVKHSTQEHYYRTRRS